MKPLTIQELKQECEKQIILGNGNKVIMISSDDEGNNYHYLWYAFTSIIKMEEPIEIGGKKYKCPFEYCDEKVAPKKDTIILG